MDYLISLVVLSCLCLLGFHIMLLIFYKDETTELVSNKRGRKCRVCVQTIKQS